MSRITDYGFLFQTKFGLSLIHISGKEKLTKSTSGRTHNTSIDSSIDLKSYIAAAKKTNQEIIENAGTQINAKTSEYMSTGCLLYTSRCV